MASKPFAASNYDMESLSATMLVKLLNQYRVPLAAVLRPSGGCRVSCCNVRLGNS